MGLAVPREALQRLKGQGWSRCAGLPAVWWMLHLGLMRYPDGGGLTAAGRARREAVRLRAAEWFDQELKPEEGTVLAWERLGSDNKGNASGTVKVEATRDGFQGVCAFGALANKRDVGRATAKNARWTVAYLRL